LISVRTIIRSRRSAPFWKEPLAASRFSWADGGCSTSHGRWPGFQPFLEGYAPPCRNGAAAPLLACRLPQRLKPGCHVGQIMLSHNIIADLID
jgi:hypothetical protein